MTPKKKIPKNKENLISIKKTQRGQKCKEPPTFWLLIHWSSDDDTAIDEM